MAIKTDYPSGAWFRGEDKLLEYTVYQADGTTPLNVSGFAFSWGFDRTPVLASTGDGSITITGTYNPDPLLNTQRVNVVIASDDTSNLGVPNAYVYQFRRTDTGSVTVLAYGTVSLQ